MSHKFILWQPSKASFKQDSTALEILNNYTKANLTQDDKNKNTEKPLKALTISSITSFESATLVYDIRADIIIGNPTPYKPCDTTYSHQEITDSNLKLYLQAMRFTPAPIFESGYSLTVPDDGVTLKFNSKFESGNLEKAIKISDTTYKLIISCDVNTHGQNHWYYFSVHNPRKSQINFEILNMLKLDDLYKSGLKPAVYSMKHFEKTGTRWHRDCTNISYKSNKAFIPGRNFYSLSFSYDFKYPDDTVFFAYSVPYTYTELQNFLQYVKESHHKIARVNSMCRTIAGNSCELLTITENIRSYTTFEEEIHKWGLSSSGRKMLKNKEKKRNANSKARENEHAEKTGIVLTARVHAGETVGSFMMKGAIEFLLGESREARILRKKFVFKIVPMLNPDGVRYGNYRCSLIGVDLNRRWDKPSRNLHPTIFYTKKMIEVFSEDHKLFMVCDMHGHSKKRNVFMYGCAAKSMDCLVLRKNLMAKVIPVYLHEKNKFFWFKDCHFRLEKLKMATERIVIYKELGIAHSYTIEASFFGPLNKKVEGTSYHMNERDLESIGEDLCRACMIFTSQSAYLAKIRLTNNFLRKIMFKRKKIKAQQGKEIDQDRQSDESTKKEDSKDTEELNEERIEFDCDLNSVPLKLDDEKMWDGIEIAEYSESDEEGSGGSDSCPSEEIEPPVVQVKKTKKKNPKKKKPSDYKGLEIKQSILKFRDESENKTLEKQNTDDFQETTQEHLKKNYSFKPQLKPSKNGQLKDYVNSVPPNLTSQNTQNIMFNYPLTSNTLADSEASPRNDTESLLPHIKDTSFKTEIENPMPHLKDKSLKLDIENPFPHIRDPHAKAEATERIRKDIRRKIRLSSEANLIESIKASSSFINASSPHNYSFEKSMHKKLENPFSYGKHIYAEFNQSPRRGYIAKNLADSALFRIEKIVSKFSTDR